MKNRKLAFSLIELSIVILIIGILIAGVTQGSRLVKQSRLSVANNMTQNSPASGIEGLVLWLDAVDGNNIATGVLASASYGAPEDGNAVAKWNDRNPQSVNKVILSSPADGNSPQYIANGIGGLPAINFVSANSQTLFTDNFAFPYANYTIFVVFDAVTNTGNNSILTLVATANNPGLSMVLNASGVFRILHRFPFGNSGGDLFTSATGSVAINTDYIVSFIRNFSTASSKVWFNNVNIINSSPVTSGFDNTSGRFSVGSLYGAANFMNFFNGYIGEIIVFNRALKQSQKQDIESYLAKKWQINLS
jgi:prepilin-type N-terminal cleavage/methylation domain-containing protein